MVSLEESQDWRERTVVRVALLSTEREEGGERWKEREKRVKERKGRDRDGRGKKRM